MKLSIWIEKLLDKIEAFLICLYFGVSAILGCGLIMSIGLQLNLLSSGKFWLSYSLEKFFRFEARILDKQHSYYLINFILIPQIGFYS
jgi:hypothetical protein